MKKVISTVVSFLVYDSVLSDVAMAAAMTRSASASGSAILLGSDSATSSPGPSGERVS